MESLCGLVRQININFYSVMEIEYKDIELTLIDFDPDNPNEMDERTFNHLCDEIKRMEGIDIDPIKVMPKGERYMMIDGEHRVLAIRKLKNEGFYSKSTVPAIIVPNIDEEIRSELLHNLNDTRGEITPERKAYFLELIDKDALNRRLLLENLNEIRGQFNPMKLNKFIEKLELVNSPEHIRKILDLTEQERNSLRILREIPDAVDMREREEHLMKKISFELTPEDYQEVTNSLRSAIGEDKEEKLLYILRHHNELCQENPA